MRQNSALVFVELGGWLVLLGLTANGVEAPTVDAPITAAFTSARQAQTLVRDLERLAPAGQPVEHAELSTADLRDQVPLASPALAAGVLIGETRVPGVYVAGGHGMWGLAQGPVTGRLLAEQVTTGEQPAALREFDPLR